MKPTECWHFLPDDGRMRYKDGRKVVVGRTYKIKGEPVLCERGFHGSKKPLDAFSYAPGSLLCRVRLSGTIVNGGDKLVATERTVLWKADATRTLHEFACWCADQALALIESPDPRSVEAVRVKRLWLDWKATDQELRDAAWSAAQAAAWSAAWSAAQAAARVAAWSAAQAAAQDAAQDAARDAAWSAAQAAAWSAARVAAQDAARVATRVAQNRKLGRMFKALEPR